MTDRHHRGQPPWWPADESWPPRTAAWRTMRRRFLRRVMLTAAALFFVIFGLSSVGWFLYGRGPEHNHWSGPPFFLFLILALGALFFARQLRRTAAPLGDVM